MNQNKTLLKLTPQLRITILAKFFTNEFHSDYKKYLWKLKTLQDSFFPTCIPASFEMQKTKIKANEAVIEKVLNDYNIEL